MLLRRSACHIPRRIDLDLMLSRCFFDSIFFWFSSDCSHYHPCFTTPVCSMRERQFRIVLHSFCHGFCESTPFPTVVSLWGGFAMFRSHRSGNKNPFDKAPLGWINFHFIFCWEKLFFLLAERNDKNPSSGSHKRHTPKVLLNVFFGAGSICTGVEYTVFIRETQHHIICF